MTVRLLIEQISLFATSVGWVERSETQHCPALGFAWRYPAE
ncbi:hypothetical protein [Pseudomonas cavernicola]|nr:hypothetical protein [Pseudomonas cavernicola]